MARHEYISRFQCSSPGCQECGRYASTTRAEQADDHKRYGNGKWKCARHGRPDDVLSMDNRRRVFEIASDQREHGTYWGHSGFVSGPGFMAWSKDFPAGTIIRVTAEIIPPSDPST